MAACGEGNQQKSMLRFLVKRTAGAGVHVRTALPAMSRCIAAMTSLVSRMMLVRIVNPAPNMGVNSGSFLLLLPMFINCCTELCNAVADVQCSRA